MTTTIYIEGAKTHFLLYSQLIEASKSVPKANTSYLEYEYSTKRCIKREMSNLARFIPENFKILMKKGRFSGLKPLYAPKFTQ